MITIASVAAVWGIYLLRQYGMALSEKQFAKGLLIDAFGNALRIPLLTLLCGFSHGFLLGWVGSNIIGIGLVLTINRLPFNSVLLGFAAFDMVVILCR